ncbi:MAG: hypothetical protein RL722_1877 [Pseudomonadota bacterium]|jgi:serine/threonine protein kinase
MSLRRTAAPAGAAAVDAALARAGTPLAGAPADGGRLGRFELRRLLGRGAQAEVWLAHDPRLQREVALKLLDPAFDHPLGDPQAGDTWLHEARAVSRLTHPNIVPIFEADRYSGRCGLVFEYVPGPTLTEHLKRRGSALPAREAVELTLGVLEALHAAHEAGIVHRDLKPSNILLGAGEVPRVMDFGIAARLAPDLTQPLEAVVAGTPGYLSPEAARGEAPAPSMDLFAAGLILGEMLAGRRLNSARDAMEALQRVATTELSLPGGLAPDVDDPLRAIVQRSLALDPARRWAGARDFHAALVGWLHPMAAPAPAASPASSPRPASGGGLPGSASAGAPAALDFLLRRMRSRSDFPAMSDAVSRIRKLTYSETASLKGLSDEILQDVALTQKLLRVVNTAHYSHAGAGSITTVTRAAALIGFAGIRNLALSLVLLEHMENKAHAQSLREDFIRSLMAAHLARELSTHAREDEEAYLCGLFHHLGRTLTEFYFPEEAQQVRRLTRPERRAKTSLGEASPPVSEQAAALQVLGISFEQLGLGVAKQWGLPKPLQQAMIHPEGEPPHHPPGQAADRQRWIAHAAHAVTDAILHAEAGDTHTQVQIVAERYARVLGVTPEAVGHATAAARHQVSELASAMNLVVPQGAPARRLLASGPGQAGDVNAPPQPGAAAQVATTPRAAHAIDPLDRTDAMLATVTLQATRREASSPHGPAAQPPRADGASPAAAEDKTIRIARPASAQAAEGQAAPAGANTSTTAGRPAQEPGAAAPPPALSHQIQHQIERLTAGIEQVTQAIVDGESLPATLRLVLASLQGGLGLRRSLLCLRDPKSDCLTGRWGMGNEDSALTGAVSAAFRIPLHPRPQDGVDLFSAICLRGVDTLIQDATEPHLARRLPGWYRQLVNAPSFLLLPLVLKGQTFGLIYGDVEQAGGISLTERELSLLRTLRNQAVMAFKQAS